MQYEKNKSQFDRYLENRAKRDRIRTPESFDARVEDTLRALVGEKETGGIAVPVRRLGRRAVAALVAAAILLVTATALAAVYFSRMQKFKDETKSALDESYAAWSPESISPDDVKTEVSGVELSLSGLRFCGADEYSSDKSLIVDFAGYDPAERGTASLENLALTVNEGEAIPCAYTPPVIFDKQTDPSEGYKAYMTAAFTVAENPLKEGNTLLLTGTLDGQSFSLRYALTPERMAQIKAEVEQQYQQATDVLAAIPQEAAEVELSFLGYTIKEVAVKDGFMYLTKLSVPEYWAEHGSRETSPQEAALAAEGIYAGIDVFPFIDGCPMLHEALGNVDQVYPDGYVYRTYIGRVSSKLPARSLIAFSGIVFYYEWASDTVIAPKDEAEQTEWRETLAALVRQNAASDALFTFSGETPAFTATDLLFCNRLYGMIGLALDTPDAYEGARTDIPVVTLDGTKLAFLGDPKFHEEAPGNSQRGNQRHGYNYVGVALSDLPDTFTLTVEWRGEKTSLTLNKADMMTDGIMRSEYKTIFGY